MEDQPVIPQTAMAAEAAELEQQRYKTLGVRVDEDLHARLTFIAQLRGNTIAEEIRQSIEAGVQTAQSDPDLVARAEQVRAEIEREALARQQAIAGLFGNLAVNSMAVGSQVEAPQAQTQTQPGKRAGRGRSGNGAAAEGDQAAG